MNKYDYMKLQNETYSRYKNTISIKFNSSTSQYYSLIKQKVVSMPIKDWLEPDEWSVFCFLHEIGHIITNTNKMKRYEQEYYATIWALKESKKIGLKVSADTIETFQEYIWEWRERSLKLRGKNVMSKRELLLRKDAA